MKRFMLVVCLMIIGWISIQAQESITSFTWADGTTENLSLSIQGIPWECSQAEIIDRFGYSEDKSDALIAYSNIRTFNYTGKGSIRGNLVFWFTDSKLSGVSISSSQINITEAVLFFQQRFGEGVKGKGNLTSYSWKFPGIKITASQSLRGSLVTYTSPISTEYN